MLQQLRLPYHHLPEQTSDPRTPGHPGLWRIWMCMQVELRQVTGLLASQHTAVDKTPFSENERLT